MLACPRPGAVWLILSLEGRRYYIFHSRQSREQVIITNAGLKRSLHRELAERFGNSERYDVDRVVQQAQLNRALPFARAIAGDEIELECRHAEEVMIESWSRCLSDFRSASGRLPNTAEIFLSHCPCQVANDSPSFGRKINGVSFPNSCYEKLKLFCIKMTPEIAKWNVYYEYSFHGRILDVCMGKLRISKRPLHILIPDSS